MKLSTWLATAFSTALLGAGSAQAAAIISAQSVSVVSGGTVGSFWTADNVIDHSGLEIDYVAGVTDFDAYVAKKPRHTGALNTEWFSSSDSRSAQLLFDFGREVTINKLAIWDEDASSQLSMSISTPLLGLVRTFSPTESDGQPYAGGEVFAFKPITTRYLTLDITGCGQRTGNGTVRYCGLGEMIFADGSAAPVPEPTTWALMILGFGAVGATVRRRRLQFA